MIHIGKTSLVHGVTAAVAAQSIVPMAGLDQGSLIEASLIRSVLPGQLPAVYGGCWPVSALQVCT